MTADWESHHLSDYSDWKLNCSVFEGIQELLGPFTVDLFASYKNTQLETYFSWKPDPSATAVDALSQSWSNHHPYVFPLCSHREMSPQDQDRWSSLGSAGSPSLACPSLVPDPDKHARTQPKYCTSEVGSPH